MVNILRVCIPLEKVQIRATKLVDGLSKLSYNERLQRLDLPTLLFRRRRDGLTGPQSNFFFQRTTKMWNDLPSYVVDADNVNQFKNRLDEIWKQHPLKYDNKATEPTDD